LSIQIYGRINRPTLDCIQALRLGDWKCRTRIWRTK